MECTELQEKISWSCWLRTMLAGIGPIVLCMYVAMDESQSAVMLPQLKEPDSLFTVTPDQETWIASFGIIMAPVSALIMGPFLDAFGRKKGLQMFFLISSSGYAVLASATELHHIYIGRLICGIGIGLFATSIVYLVEICTNKQREYLFSVFSAIYASGVTIMSIVSGYLSWRIASSIFSVVAFIFFILQCFVPESPAWLFRMGKEDAAIRSYETLGRRKSGIRRELDNLELQCKNKTEAVELSTFLEPTVWKPFIIMVTFFMLTFASGLIDILYYTVDFVDRLGTNYDPLSVAIAINSTRLLACASVVIFFRVKVSRKFAVVFSGFWMAVAFAGLGAYEYVYSDVDVSDRSFQWFVVVCLLLYISACTLGMLGLPWVMTGEVYPLKVRGTMTSVTHVIECGIVFFFIKSYHARIEWLQMHGLLFSFAGFAFTTVLFAIFVLPETRNKTLYEIEQGFLSKKDRQFSHKRFTDED